MTSYYRRLVSGQQNCWNRPVTRMYTYNYQVGENYYHPMTQYLDYRSTQLNRNVDTPGAMDFSERLAQRWITGRTDFSSLDGNVVAPPMRVFEHASTSFF